jgi:hypothetical protein
MQRPPSHAARQRRYRRRQHRGELMVTLGLSPHEIDKLHRVGCLDLDKLENRGALANALHLLIAAIEEDA